MFILYNTNTIYQIQLDIFVFFIVFLGFFALSALHCFKSKQTMGNIIILNASNDKNNTWVAQRHVTMSWHVEILPHYIRRDRKCSAIVHAKFGVWTIYTAVIIRLLALIQRWFVHFAEINLEICVLISRKWKSNGFICDGESKHNIWRIERIFELNWIRARMPHMHMVTSFHWDSPWQLNKNTMNGIINYHINVSFLITHWVCIIFSIYMSNFQSNILCLLISLDNYFWLVCYEYHFLILKTINHALKLCKMRELICKLIDKCKHERT